MDLVSKFDTNCQKTILSLKEDLKTIRTGQANPSLVENIVVETYGGSTKLRLLELATIMTDGPSALSISPFDPSTIQDIEKAILKSPLSLSPSVQGTRIIIKIPTLSTEQREKFIKIVSSKIEEKKEIIRAHRDDIRKTLKNQLESKEITEDDKYRVEKEVDNTSQKYMEEIETIREKKELDIRAV